MMSIVCRHVLVLIVLVLSCMFEVSHAQTDEAALIEAVREAEAEVQTAQTDLQNLKREYDPKIEAYEKAVQALNRLRDETGKAYDAINVAYDKVKRLPESLRARENALMDVLIRLYEQNGDSRSIRQKERELKDVRQQIARFNQSNIPAKLRLRQARMRADRLYKALERARRKEDELSLDARTGRALIRDAEEVLADAREELERIKSNARWRLNENAPPYLAEVKVKQGGDIFYHAEWHGDEEDTEDLLKLAQYLHEDLSRTIPERQKRVDEWIAFVQDDMATAKAAMRKYVDYMGGSHDDAFWGSIERGLDAISGGTLGAVVTGGAHPWKKIGVELGDSALTIFRDQLEDKIPWQVAVVKEAAWQLIDLGYREFVTGEAKNPSWDVTSMPHASAPETTSISNDPMKEKAMFDAINKQRVRGSLERLRDEVKAGLEGEDFRDKLLRQYKGRKLAVAFTQTTATQKPPVLNFDGRNPITGDKTPAEWIWGLFSSPSGMVKTAAKTRFYEGYTGDAGNIGKDMFLDALQAAARDGLLEALERERLEIWYNWVYADADLQLSVAFLKNEGRILRMDKKIRKTLAEEIIPELTREIESLRATRSLKIIKDGGTKGKKAKLELVFTDEVNVESIKLGDVDLEPKGKGKKWRASINLNDFDEAQNAKLIIVARHAALEDRQLDDPKTVASWSTQTKAFNSYEPQADDYHTIRLEPPAGVGYAIILDTSGSMGSQGNENRMPQAKAALAEFFASGQVKDKDVAGLFTFSGCSVAQSVPFTQDIEAVKSAISGAGTYGDTPLASSISQASTALTKQNIERGVLIVVTDGEDSCGGGVGAALSQAKERIDGIRQRIVR